MHEVGDMGRLAAASGHTLECHSVIRVSYSLEVPLAGGGVRFVSTQAMTPRMRHGSCRRTSLLSWHHPCRTLRNEMVEALLAL